MIYRLDKNSPQIYTTGAYLRPLQITDAEGKECWIWYVEQFEDDTYKSSNICNPNIVADTLEKLIEETTE
jgi:hypothetical protein